MYKCKTQHVRNHISQKWSSTQIYVNHRNNTLTEVLKMRHVVVHFALLYRAFYLSNSMSKCSVRWLRCSLDSCHNHRSDIYHAAIMVNYNIRKQNSFVTLRRLYAITFIHCISL